MLLRQPFWPLSRRRPRRRRYAYATLSLLEIALLVVLPTAAWTSTTPSGLWGGGFTNVLMVDSTGNLNVGANVAGVPIRQ
jgi:hypothetical protein